MIYGAPSRNTKSPGCLQRHKDTLISSHTHARTHTRACVRTHARTHILLECPITTELVQKNEYNLNAYNNVRNILYNTDVITNIVKSIVHSPVGKLV